MKYLGMLAALVIIYFILARETPLEQVKEAIVQTEAAPLSQGGRDPAPPTGSALKRPLDRTNETSKKVQARNGDGEF